MMETPEQPPEDLLDPEQIQMLLETGADDSMDLFNEILALFEEESSAKFDEMKATREKGDYEGFSRAAHALAGSSANIGGRAVWLMARDMENLCKGGQPEKAIVMLPELERLYNRTLLEMKDFAKQAQSGEA
ncbi:MAG: Hpt domain-containing protein [Puniceicoccaceae bacterium]